MGPSTPTQVELLIKLKYHEAAGMTEGDFEDCAGKPKNVGGLLVVSETLICITKQCSLLGIVNKLDMRQLQAHENVVPLPKKFMYWCYGIDDGRAMRGISPQTAIQHLSDSRRFPAPTALVLAIFREDIQVISENNRIDIGGSRIEGDLIPALLLGNGSTREHYPNLSSSELSSAGKPTYGMASFERVE